MGARRVLGLITKGGYCAGVSLLCKSGRNQCGREQWEDATWTDGKSPVCVLDAGRRGGRRWDRLQYWPQAYSKEIDVRQFTEQLLLIRDSSSGRPWVKNCKYLNMIPRKAGWTELGRGTDTEWHGACQRCSKRALCKTRGLFVEVVFLNKKRWRLLSHDFNTKQRGMRGGELNEM